MENLIKKRVDELVINKEDVTLDYIYNIIAGIITEIMHNRYLNNVKEFNLKRNKKIYYISMEFLMGKRLRDNIVNMDLEHCIENVINDYGFSLEELYCYDVETKLGSGGLGRLGACFLDSFASLNIPGYGYSLLYEKGLFKQEFIDQKQVEYPEEWLYKGDKQLVNECEKVYDIEFNENHIEKVVAFDMLVAGMNEGCSALRLFKCVSDKKITESLYPNDDNEEGKKLRIKQQYLLSSSAIQDIINEYLKNKENKLKEISKYISIHINDTHPALCIPEFIRLLIDKYSLDFNEALLIAKDIFSYTNHTILIEALEKWNINMFKGIIPRIYEIIEKIDKENNIEKIIDNGFVHMARLCVFVSKKVNGVSKIHSEIIKNEVFYKFNEKTPEKFLNITNGVSQRKWLINNNDSLKNLIERKLKCQLKDNFRKIKEIISYKDDLDFLSELGKIKYKNKKVFCEYIKKKCNIDIDYNSIFDVQIKRIHEYKRQLLNVLKIVYLIIRLEENKIKFNKPITFIFSGKAAPSYKEAKNVIELILNISKYLQNKGLDKILNVVYIPNYDIEIAEKLIPASDISEQISLAGMEASGTGNMKFMMNGAVTLGTLDGANVEICDFVGEDNIVIFGMNKEEVEKKRKEYNPKLIYESNSEIKKVLDRLDIGFNKSFKHIKEYLLNNDRFMCLADFDSYIKGFEKIISLYEDEERWNKVSLVNIGYSSYFSSDRTINEYLDKIWN